MKSERRRSFEKINYLLRPSKQVERKLIVEALHKLELGGIDIRQYTYFGLGSPYYADFLLFHKYLYIDKMICVEGAPIPRRMKFNKPFGFIKLEMGTVADVIPRLRSEVRYLVWLDYDVSLSPEILQDVAGCLHRLSRGSILIVTVDADPERLGLSGDINLDADKLEQVVGRLKDEFGKYYAGDIDARVVTYRSLPRFCAAVLRSLIAQEMAAKPPNSFLQLLSFRYADGSQMLTVGGILTDNELSAQVHHSGVYSLPYVTRKQEPLPIAVPPLTLREKQWLDSKITRKAKPIKVAFEIDAYMLRNFRKYYKHYPTYYETLV